MILRPVALDDVQVVDRAHAPHAHRSTHSHRGDTLDLGFANPQAGMHTRNAYHGIVSETCTCTLEPWLASGMFVSSCTCLLFLEQYMLP